MCKQTSSKSNLCCCQGCVVTIRERCLTTSWLQHSVDNKKCIRTFLWSHNVKWLLLLYLWRFWWSASCWDLCLPKLPFQPKQYCGEHFKWDSRWKKHPRLCRVPAECKHWFKEQGGVWEQYVLKTEMMPMCGAHIWLHDKHTHAKILHLQSLWNSFVDDGEQ